MHFLWSISQLLQGDESKLEWSIHFDPEIDMDHTYRFHSALVFADRTYYR